MSEGEQPQAGVVESLRRLCDSFLAQLQTRVELFAVELQEEKARLVRVVVIAAGVFFLAALAVVMVTITIVWLAGPDARTPLLIGFSVLYVAAAIWGIFALRKLVLHTPPPFQDTISELKKDRDWLSSRK